MINSTLKEVILLTWPTLVIVLSIFIILRVSYILRCDRGFKLHEELFDLLFVAYILILFQLVTSQDISGGGTNLMPFKEIFRYDFGTREFTKQVIGNIIMFMPLGYFAGNYCKIKKISGIALITFLCSFIIESVQHFIGRSFDIDDIILNVFGGIFGFLVLIALRAIESHLPDFLRRDWFKNILCILLVFVIGIFIFKII